MTPAGKALILSIATMGLVGLVILAMCLAGLHPPGTAGAFFAGLGLFMIALVPVLAVFLMIQNPSLRRAPPRIEVGPGNLTLSHPGQSAISLGDQRALHYSSPNSLPYASGIHSAGAASGLHTTSGLYPSATSSGIHPIPRRGVNSGIHPAVSSSGLHPAATSSGIHRAPTSSGIHRAAPHTPNPERRESGYAITPLDLGPLDEGAPSLFSMDPVGFSGSGDAVSSMPDVRDTYQQDDPFFHQDSHVLIHQSASATEEPMDTGQFSNVMGSIESLVGGAATSELFQSFSETEERSPFEQADTNIYVRRELQPLLVNLSKAGVESPMVSGVSAELPNLEQRKMPRPRMPLVTDDGLLIRKTSLRADNDPWVEEPTGVLPPSAVLALRWASSDEAPLKQEAPQDPTLESAPSSPAMSPTASRIVGATLDLDTEMDRMRKALDFDGDDDDAPEGNSDLIKIMAFIDDFGEDDEANSFRSLVADGLDVEEIQPLRKAFSGGFNSSTGSSIDIPSIGDTQENVFVLLGIGDVGSSRPEALRKSTGPAPEAPTDSVFSPPFSSKP